MAEDIKATDSTQADGYYDDDMGSDELDLSFMDEESKDDSKKK
jgi:hypothetical protein